MGRINVLTADVYNKISAGEVVERPSSAIKELVENSIDAGARRIVIEIENGGFRLISVSDNGCGIYEDDLQAAFTKHGTSKLFSADDLNSIQTLGFRGEALPSISAVAHVTLTTRQTLAETAVCVEVENGEIVSKRYLSANVGTKIEVRDLFYNTPARKKFMKTGARESTDVTKFISKLILTNPNLSITYIVDGKTVYKTNGEGLSEAIFVVYGDDCLANCLPVSYESGYMRITGYAGTPEYSKPNTIYQTLSVNGRYIVDKGIQSAITQAYKPYLMTKQFPFFVINLDIPCDMVDVNVHPRKTEVRFENASAVNGRFFHAVENALLTYKSQKMSDDLGIETYEQPSLNMQQYTADDFDKSKLFRNISEMTPHQVEDILQIEKTTREQRHHQPFAEFAEELNGKLTVANARKAIGLDVDGVQQPASMVIQPTEPFIPPVEKDITDDLLAKTRILGAAFKTYLILETGNKVIFVDQHAAHERILFDKFMERKPNIMQDIMFPYVFTVKDEEAEFIESNLDNILKAGIKIEPFGKNTFRIVSVSTLLADTEMKDFVNYLLSSVEEFRLDDRTLIVEKIAKKACKAAVKAGYVLNESEIRYILKSMYEGNVLQCPHGRPVTVVFTKTQLEKMFKRLV